MQQKYELFLCKMPNKIHVAQDFYTLRKTY